MAGHSHWAGIKHKKGKADKQKSKITADVPDPSKGDIVGKVKAEVEGTKLRKLLNELHSDEEQ